MKTPDEIKKGLECCSVGIYENICANCPYSSLAMAECPTKLKTDALALIQQLEAERDAAVADLTDMGTSLRYGDACNWCDKTECENGCGISEHDIGFKWRGVQKEEPPIGGDNDDFVHGNHS